MEGSAKDTEEGRLRELAAMLELVQFNIYSLVQEWNDIQELISSTLMDEGYLFGITPISISPMSRRTSLTVPSKQAAHDTSFTISPEHHPSPVTNVGKEKYHLNSSESTPVEVEGVMVPHIIETSSELAYNALPITTKEIRPELRGASKDSFFLCSNDHISHDKIDEDIPGSQIMLAAESASQTATQCSPATSSCNHTSKPEYLMNCESSNLKTSGSAFIPLPGHTSDVLASGDTNLHGCTSNVPDGYSAMILDACASNVLDGCTSNIASSSCLISEYASVPMLSNSKPSAGLFVRSCSVNFKSVEDHNSSISDMLHVRASDLDRLTTEAMMLKEYLPKVVNSYYISCIRRVPVLEGKLAELRKEKEGLALQCKNLHRRCDVMMADLEEGRKELFTVKSEVCELRELLSQQADYCSSMGSSCCMLLWRVSRHEDCIQSILSGNKVTEFLELASNTLLSFVEAYKDSALPEDSSAELQFVLALCGTITNIAACTYGREFLSSCEDGKRLIDSFCSVTVAAPLHPNYCKLRGLLLMALYNISINTTGIRHLTSRSKFLSELTWLLKEEVDITNRLHIMRLLQSMIFEQVNSGSVQGDLQNILSVLQQLSMDHNTEVQNLAVELLQDLAPLTGHRTTQNK